MRQIIWFMLAMILIMSGCADDATGAGEGQKQDNDEKEMEESEDKQAESKDNNPESDENESNDNEEQKDNSEEEQTSEDQPEDPVYKIDEETSSVVPINEEDEDKVVLLTIDDAPDTYALDMAKTLKDLDAGAIFFVNGHFLNASEGKDMLKKIHDMGFPIGNHTVSHAYLPDLSTEEQKEEIISLNDTIKDIIGERPQFFRPPNGANTDFTEQLVKDEAMVSMNWTYGYDYFEPYQDAEKLTEAMISGKGPEVDISYSLLKPGANLLMHDRKWTDKALEDIVKGLRDKGYKIVDPSLIQTM